MLVNAFGRYEAWFEIGGKHFAFRFRRVRKIAEKRLLASSCLCVRPHGTTRLPLDGRIFMKFDIQVFFFYNLSKKFRFHQNLTRITEELYTFMIISRWILFRTRSISATRCRETQNTYFVFCNFFPENHSVDEISVKYVRARQATDDNITGACALCAGLLRLQTHTQNM